MYNSSGRIKKMATSSRTPYQNNYPYYDYNTPYNDYYTGQQQQHYPQQQYNPDNCRQPLQQPVRSQTYYGGQQQHDRPVPNSNKQNMNKNKNVNGPQNFRERANPNQEDLKIYICPGCSSHYDCISRSNRYTGKVPLILNCHHTVCQECIYKGALIDNIVCPTCKKTSELTNKHLIDNIQEAFTPNYYLFGIIMWTKPLGNNFKHVGLVPTQVLVKNKKSDTTEQLDLPEETGEQCCFLSCTKVATLRCQDCSDVYCVNCCTVVHKSAKSLWSHVQVQITKGNFSAELEKCAEHGMDMEFLCNTCDAGACCYCFIEKHEGHVKDNLSKLNDEELSEFIVYREQAEKVLKQLLISQKKLKNITSGNTSATEAKVCKYFADLHAQLYFIQKDLQKDLSTIEGLDKAGSGFTNIHSNLNSSINNLKLILTSAENMNNKKINLRGLLQKLKDAVSTPCYLLSESGQAADLIDFEVNPVLNQLEQFFKINKITDSKYSLVSEDQLPADYVIDAADLQYESDAESCISSLLQSSKKGSVSFAARCSSPNSVLSSQPSVHNRRKKGKETNEILGYYLNVPLDNELVEVTHIESLECFYIQLKKGQFRLNQMHKDIDNFVKMGGTKVENPQINELYLAMYVTKTEKMWCRGRIVDIKNRQPEKMYEVFFIDYGSTQVLNISKLREITSNLAQKKPFAIQCELYNPTHANWSKNAHVYMGKMINGKQVYMLVKNINNGIYQVDLMVSSSDRGLTSIVDILINTWSNVLSTSSDSSSVSSQRKESFMPECKVFSNSTKFHKNQIENVVIANVMDPHHIYVHIASYVESLMKMNNQLKYHYKKMGKETCIPFEGTFVIVECRDPIRGNWHRAFVKKVDVNQNTAHVLLIDWGNSVVVSWSNIRMMSENFTKLESQAILVKLAHVEPYDVELGWSDKAALFLQKNFTRQETLKMIVHNVEPLEVALFEITETADICINAQLVKEKLADSTGKISQTITWPCNEERIGFTEEEGFVATLLKKVDDSVDVDSEEEDPEVENLVKQQIDVVKVVSPDLIYIKFLHLEKKEQLLHNELQIHYLKEQQTKQSWEENEDCVVPFTDYYVRGKILEKVGDKYKINVYDKATELVLPKEKIYVYSDYFSRYPNIVYKSYLARIRPAGGDKWSLSSTEALEGMFEKYKDIYATKVQGDMSKKSFPMLMWYTQIKVGGALEPTITKFISINNLLVKLGFAFKQQADAVSDKPLTESNDATLQLSENTVVTSAIVHAKLDQSLDSVSSEEHTSTEIVKSADAETLSDEIKRHLEITSDKGLNSSSSDWNDLIEEEEEETKAADNQDSPYHTREAEIVDWIPAFPIKKTEFNAWITCAEPEGILYLRPEELQAVYKNMEDNLKQYFDNKPPDKKKPKWAPGQICTISYKDYWYRGKVVEVKGPKEIIAVMIDFGSDHILKPEQLCREILYPEIPAFASRIKLDRVYAKSGSWLSSDYDKLLEIVTEFAKVVIKGPLDVEVPSAEVYTKNGQSVNQLLVNSCSNLTRCLNFEADKTDDECVVIEKEEPLPLTDFEEIPVDAAQYIPIDTTHMKYEIAPLPKDALKERILMTVVSVLSHNRVALKEPDDPVDSLFLLSEKIQEGYATQPALNTLEVDMPCICPYAEDGVWYRAKIHNLSGMDCGYVFVFFVDFGNVESVSVNDLKMMRPEWFELPVSCYVANVNFELNTDNHVDHVLQHMKKLEGKNKWVQFISENPLVVNLYDLSGDLFYQSLINKGLLKVK